MNTHANKVKVQDIPAELQAQPQLGVMMEESGAERVSTHGNLVEQMQAIANSSPVTRQLRAYEQIANTATVQRQPSANQTGLPDSLKSGVESLSGIAMDDVRVHYNSDKPSQLQAHAYAQGTEIHVAPGQERHLAHEAWHVVQQKQGRVKPTMQLKEKVLINDDEGLEKEADKMGEQAEQLGKTAR